MFILGNLDLFFLSNKFLKHDLIFCDIDIHGSEIFAFIASNFSRIGLDILNFLISFEGFLIGVKCSYF